MYHYIGCGLSNVYLKNGYAIKQTPYGQGVSIHNLEGLHQAIGRNIALNAAAMTGEQFRFLRKELELSQASVGSLVGRDAQSVALWEKKDGGKGIVPAFAANYLRLVYLERLNGNVKVEESINRINELDRVVRDSEITLSDTEDGWMVEAA
jgi:DNA-binding transcriptional regulator YiaG